MEYYVTKELPEVRVPTSKVGTLLSFKKLYNKS